MKIRFKVPCQLPLEDLVGRIAREVEGRIAREVEGSYSLTFYQGSRMLLSDSITYNLESVGQGEAVWRYHGPYSEFLQSDVLPFCFTSPIDKVEIIKVTDKALKVPPFHGPDALIKYKEEVVKRYPEISEVIKKANDGDLEAWFEICNSFLWDNRLYTKYLKKKG